MRLKSLVIGSAALLPLAASSAWALAPAATAAVPVGNQLYISGSTAIDSGLKSFFELDPGFSADAPCAAGTMDLYTTATGYAVSCTGGAKLGALAGQPILVLKQTQGGSAGGVVQVARGVAIAGFPDITTFVATCAAPVNAGLAAPLQVTANKYACTGAEISVVPNAGVSDIDPTTFVGSGGVLASDANALTSANGVQQPFGVIVSKQLFNALQAAEGLPSPSDAYANIPSLSMAQLRAIFSEQMLDWGDLWVSNAAGTTSVQIGNGTTSPMHICERGLTSGSEASANIYLFGKGCSKGNNINALVAPDRAASQNGGEAWNSATAAIVSALAFAGSGTGDVKKCVGYDGALPAGDTTNYRIGFIGADNKPTDGALDKWRYIAINGAAPTIYNVLLGRYDFVTEDTFNSTVASLALNGGLANHGVLFNYITGNIGNKVAIAGYNSAFQGSTDLAGSLPAATAATADTGILTLGKTAPDANALTFPLNAAYPNAMRLTSGAANTGPASTMTRTPPGGAVNNCNGLLQVNPTG